MNTNDIETTPVMRFPELYAPETYEGIIELWTVRPGDEIRYGGKWLEVVSVKLQRAPGMTPQPVHAIIIKAYDEVENRDHTLHARPDAEWRVRQLIEAA